MSSLFNRTFQIMQHRTTLALRLTLPHTRPILLKRGIHTSRPLLVCGAICRKTLRYYFTSLCGFLILNGRHLLLLTNRSRGLWCEGRYTD